MFPGKSLEELREGLQVALSDMCFVGLACSRVRMTVSSGRPGPGCVGSASLVPVVCQALRRVGCGGWSASRRMRLFGSRAQLRPGVWRWLGL